VGPLEHNPIAWKAHRSGWPDIGYSLLSIVVAWLIYVALVAIRLAVSGISHQFAIIERHMLTALGGIVLTGALYLVLRLFETAPMAVRLLAALCLSGLPAVLLAWLNYDMLFVFAPAELWPGDVQLRARPATVISATMTESYLLFATWAALYTAVSSAIQGQAARLRAAEFEAQAHAAQLRALRYQINPHFLFNALNTVSALILRSDRDGAEQAVQSLSAFLRHILTQDAMDDTTLAEEIRLQTMYLDIEHLRFGNRLDVSISVPAELAQAQVPALLLQPLVENVIRHALGRVRTRVHLAVSAWVEDRQLHIAVEDDARSSTTDSVHSGGHGVGLRNVSQRLRTRFGNQGQCRHGPLPRGGFRVEVVLPFRLVAQGA